MSPVEPIRLTKLAKRAGCAAKQPPEFHDCGVVGRGRPDEHARVGDPR